MDDPREKCELCSSVDRIIIISSLDRTREHYVCLECVFENREKVEKIIEK